MSLCTLFNPWQRMPPSRLKMGSGLKLGKCSALNNLDFSISHILTTAYPMRSTKLQLPTQSSTRCCVFKDLKTFCCFNASSVIQAKKNHRHKLISDKPQPAELSRYKVWGIIFLVLMSPQCPRAAAGVTLPPSLDISDGINYSRLCCLDPGQLGLNYFYCLHPEPEISTNHGNPSINRSQMVIGQRYPDFIAITISQLLKISTPNRVY